MVDSVRPLIIIMSKFQNNNLSLLKDRHGTSVTHVAHPYTTGTSTVITAIWHPNRTDGVVFDDGGHDVSFGNLRVHKDDMPVYDKRDYFLINGVKWAIEGILRESLLIEFQLKRFKSRHLGKENTFLRRD